MSDRTTAATSPSYKWWVLLVLTLAHSCHVMDRMVISVVMEPIRREFSLTDTQLGLVSSLGFGLFYGAAVLPMGMLIDRSVRKVALSLVLGIWSALTVVCGLATGWVMLLVTRCAVGVAESGGSPAGLSLLTDYFPVKQRATAVGLWYLSSAIGTIVTFIVGAFVAAHYGWRAAFFLAGAPGIIMAFVVYTFVREPKRGASDIVDLDPASPAPEPATSAPVAKLGFAQSMARVCARRPAVHIMVGTVMTSSAISSYSTWSVSFLVRRHGLDLSQAGLMMGLSAGVLGAMGGALFGVLADRGTRRDPNGNPWRSGAIASALALVSTVLGIASLLIVPTPAALGLMLLYTFVFTSYNGPANGLLLTVVPVEVRGFTVALLQLGATLIGFGVAPFMVGRLSDMIGGPNSLGYALALMLLFHPWAALHYGLAARYVRRHGPHN